MSFFVAFMVYTFSSMIFSTGNLEAEKIMLRRFQMEELEKATRNFSKACLLGYGGFGNVYKGTFEGEGTLAIKVAHSDSYPLEEFRNGKLQPSYVHCQAIKQLVAVQDILSELIWFLCSLETEVRLLSQVNHRNLVNLVGFCEGTGM